jgi:hypothetical protein
MPDLFFPQLTSGAMAQYPIRRTRVGRTVKNVLPGGTLVAYPDPSASRLMWELGYGALSLEDIDTLANHFNSCQGRLHAFTFIDPAGNMLASSSSFVQQVWSSSKLLGITSQALDPLGSFSAFTVTNAANIGLELTQTVSVPSSYQYCFSVYVRSDAAATLQLLRRGSAVQQMQRAPVSKEWSRVTSAGRLADAGTILTVGVVLDPGQQICLYGPQVEPQLKPSRYKATAQAGGVYTNAHWASDEFSVAADAPDSFSTTVRIEASV